MSRRSPLLPCSPAPCLPYGLRSRPARPCNSPTWTPMHALPAGASALSGWRSAGGNATWSPIANSARTNAGSAWTASSDWRLEIRGWKLEVGSWKLELLLVPLSPCLLVSLSSYTTLNSCANCTGRPTPNCLMRPMSASHRW